MKLPRILITAPSSGSGKTLITCGILQALVNRGQKAAAFKCGPDYIDPMFHGRVVGVPSKNLDTFFCTPELTRYLFSREAEKADISVMEGVMGYYDGVGALSTRASAYDLACVTKTPVILVVDAKGMSLSAAALVQGFLQYRSDSNIKGVILNRMSPMLYPAMKEQIERELPVKVIGYVPEAREYVIESRHLGLVTPGEIAGLKEKLNGLARVLEETLALDRLMELANEAPELTVQKPVLPKLEGPPVKIAVARDEAFCFCYRDNLELMEEIGADLRFFSPLADPGLPHDLDGLILYGGYPELYAKQLSRNETMLREIRAAADAGIPYLAECGGFMYLHTQMEDMDGRAYPMADVIKGKAFRTKKLSRFGYVELTAKGKQILGEAGMKCLGHEFHYFDSTSCGNSFLAQKPRKNRQWDCIHADGQRAAGFPHLYYYSNPDMIYRFLKTCQERRNGNAEGDD